MISWTTTKEEALLIGDIVRRAYKMRTEKDSLDPVTLNMDITACHANGCPLKLTELLAASNLEFSHDVFGIRQHINRDTGKLTGQFLPRYAEDIV